MKAAERVDPFRQLLGETGLDGDGAASLRQTVSDREIVPPVAEDGQATQSLRQPPRIPAPLRFGNRGLIAAGRLPERPTAIIRARRVEQGGGYRVHRQACEGVGPAITKPRRSA